MPGKSLEEAPLMVIARSMAYLLVAVLPLAKEMFSYVGRISVRKKEGERGNGAKKMPTRAAAMAGK